MKFTKMIYFPKYQLFSSVPLNILFENLYAVSLTDNSCGANSISEKIHFVKVTMLTGYLDSKHYGSSTSLHRLRPKFCNGSTFRIFYLAKYTDSLLWLC